MEAKSSTPLSILHPCTLGDRRPEHPDVEYRVHLFEVTYITFKANLNYTATPSRQIASMHISYRIPRHKSTP